MTLLMVAQQQTLDKLENIHTMSIQILVCDAGEFDVHHNGLILLYDRLSYAPKV
jgi:hypothetical protein